MDEFIGKKILLVTGPTVAPIDAVRVISNRSTGRLGSAIALHMIFHGAEIIQLAGKSSLTVADFNPDLRSRFQIIPFETVDELETTLKSLLETFKPDAVLMAAAVLDYIPSEPMAEKKSSTDDEWTLTLKKGEKIIEKIKQWNPDGLLVGFKLEANLTVDELQERASDLMDRSAAEFVIANRLEDITHKQHIAYLVERKQDSTTRISDPLPTRKAIAQELSKALAKRWINKGAL